MLMNGPSLTVRCFPKYDHSRTVSLSNFSDGTLDASGGHGRRGVLKIGRAEPDARLEGRCSGEPRADGRVAVRLGDLTGWGVHLLAVEKGGREVTPLNEPFASVCHRLQGGCL